AHSRHHAHPGRGEVAGAGGEGRPHLPPARRRVCGRPGVAGHGGR
ncbi:MAG: hypothetical protein AVDCRST_MAG22-2134, partial [uncultured Rubrobacteraceae bacterium]